MPAALPCSSLMPAMPNTCLDARPTSAMRSGCSGSILDGLLRASFRPKGQIAELRAYVRQRERLLEYAASHIQHMQKALTEMILQLHHVVADITGATGLRIIRAILAGEHDPKVLARLRDYRCHASVRQSRRRSPVATAPSTCLRWNRHSPSTTLTTIRCRPATPGSKPF